MKTDTIQKLSSELQDIQLRNKQWLSGVIFLENETRFIQRLCNRILTNTSTEIKFQDIQLINSRLNDLEELKEQLKKLVNFHEHIQKTFIDDLIDGISVENIQDYKDIMNDINALFTTDSGIKKELYSFLDHLILDDKVKQLINS